MSILANKDNNNDTTKKESKKKKKKKQMEKEVEKNLNKDKLEAECKVTENIVDKTDSPKETFNRQEQTHCISAGKYSLYFTIIFILIYYINHTHVLTLMFCHLYLALCRILNSLFLWTVIFGIVFGSLIIILPLYNKELSYTIMDNIEKHTGIFLKTYQRYGTELLQNRSQILMKWMNHACKTINDIYNGYNFTNII